MVRPARERDRRTHPGPATTYHGEHGHGPRSVALRTPPAAPRRPGSRLRGRRPRRPRRGRPRVRRRRRAGPWARLATGVPAAPAASAGERVDLSTVMRRAHFAFRGDGDGWKGGHASYAVRADRGLHLIPRLPGAADGEPPAAAFDATVTGIERGGGRDRRAPRGPLHATPGGGARGRPRRASSTENGVDGVEQSFRRKSAPADGETSSCASPPRARRTPGRARTGCTSPTRRRGSWVRARDLSGRARRHDARARVRGGSISVTVPVRWSTRRRTPPTIDPGGRAGALGMDNPVRVGATDTQNDARGGVQRDRERDAGRMGRQPERHDHRERVRRRLRRAGHAHRRRARFVGHPHQHGQQQPAHARRRVRRKRSGSSSSRDDHVTAGMPRHHHGAGLDGGHRARSRRELRRRDRHHSNPAIACAGGDVPRLRTRSGRTLRSWTS